jgi:uncharacterized RDD family membrane protein YckC
MSEQAFALCVSCGLDLNGRSTNCPRCGAPITPGQPPVAAPADSPGGRTVSRSQLRRMSVEPDSLSPSGATRLTDPSSTGSAQPMAGGLAQAAQWTSSPQAPRAPVPLGDPGPARAQPVWATATDAGDALPAGLGTRLLARLLDSVLLTSLFVFIVLVAVLIPFEDRFLIGSVLKLALIIFAIAYEFVAVGRLGQTVGRRVLGIQVVDHINGVPIGVGRAILRVFVFALMGLPFYLGYLSYFFDGSGEHRAWHDKAADDRVVRVPRVSLGRSVRDVLSAMTP